MKVATFRTTIAVALGIFLSSAGASAQESIEYYATDAVGSVRVVFDSTGAVESRMDYEPFGQVLFQPTIKPKEQFAGWLHDEETDLAYAEARQYQSHTGRFTTVDPVFADIGDPSQLNRYAYALNSPIIMGDPNGLEVTYCGQTKHGSLIFCDNTSVPMPPTPTQSGGGPGGGGGNHGGPHGPGGPRVPGDHPHHPGQPPSDPPKNPNPPQPKPKPKPKPVPTRKPTLEDATPATKFFVCVATVNTAMAFSFEGAAGLACMGTGPGFPECVIGVHELAAPALFKVFEPTAWSACGFILAGG